MRGCSAVRLWCGPCIRDQICPFQVDGQCQKSSGSIRGWVVFCTDVTIEENSIAVRHTSRRSNRAPNLRRLLRIPSRLFSRCLVRTHRHTFQCRWRAVWRQVWSWLVARWFCSLRSSDFGEQMVGQALGLDWVGHIW